MLNTGYRYEQNLTVRYRTGTCTLVGKGYSVPCSNCDDDEQKDSNNNNDEHSDRMDAENESQAAC